MTQPLSEMRARPFVQRLGRQQQALSVVLERLAPGQSPEIELSR